MINGACSPKEGKEEVKDRTYKLDEALFICSRGTRRPQEGSVLCKNSFPVQLYSTVYSLPHSRDALYLAPDRILDHSFLCFGCRYTHSIANRVRWCLFSKHPRLSCNPVPSFPDIWIRQDIISTLHIGVSFVRHDVLPLLILVSAGCHPSPGRDLEASVKQPHAGRVCGYEREGKGEEVWMAWGVKGTACIQLHFCSYCISTDQRT